MVLVSPLKSRAPLGKKQATRSTAPLRADRLPALGKGVVRRPPPAVPKSVEPAADAHPGGPFLKWAGGKRQLLPDLLHRVPTLHAGRYHEPFVGGGALFFALSGARRLGPRGARLCDINAELINAYQVVRDDVEGLIRLLRQQHNTEEHYYEVRALDPRTLSKVERACRLIYLNKTCFNGLFRENRSGTFNVPFGRYARPNICAEPTLRAASAALRGVSIGVASFEETAHEARPGDFVYCDPPYVPVSRTASFVRYSAGGFDDDAQARLALTAATMAERGINIMLSNSVAPLVKDLYHAFEQEEVAATRAINSRADRRGKVGELILCAGPAFRPAVRRSPARTRATVPFVLPIR